MIKSILEGMGIAVVMIGFGVFLMSMPLGKFLVMICAFAICYNWAYTHLNTFYSWLSHVVARMEKP